MLQSPIPMWERHGPTVHKDLNPPNLRVSLEAESALVGRTVAADNTLTVTCEEPWERRPR